MSWEYDKYKRPYYLRHRSRWLAAGLTTRGRPRLRPYKNLAGMTDAQKRDRRRALQREWRRLDYQRRGV